MQSAINASVLDVDETPYMHATSHPILFTSNNNYCHKNVRRWWSKREHWNMGEGPNEVIHKVFDVH